MQSENGARRAGATTATTSELGAIAVQAEAGRRSASRVRDRCMERGGPCRRARSIEAVFRGALQCACAECGCLPLAPRLFCHFLTNAQNPHHVCSQGFFEIQFSYLNNPPKDFTNMLNARYCLYQNARLYNREFFNFENRL